MAASLLFQSLLFRLYAGVGAIVFCVYVTLLVRDRETPLTDGGSWLVLILATIFWPIALPISLVSELLPRWREARYTGNKRQIP